MNVSKLGLVVGGLAIATGLMLPDRSLAQRRERVGESGTGRVPAGGGRGTGGGAGVGGAAGTMIGGRVGSSVPSGSQVRNNIRGEAYGRPTDSYRRGTSGLDRAADRFDRKWFDDSPDATERGTNLERAVDRTSRRDQDWIDRENPPRRFVERDEYAESAYRGSGALANDPDRMRRDRYDDRASRRIDNDRRVADRDVYDRRSYTFDGADRDIDFEERSFDRAVDRIDRNRDRFEDRTERTNRGLDTASDRVRRNRERTDDRFDDRLENRDNSARDRRDRERDSDDPRWVKDDSRDTGNRRDREDRERDNDDPRWRKNDSGDSRERSGRVNRDR